MIFAIVGSQIAERGETLFLIHKYLAEKKPDLIISGGAKGVDTWARECAMELRIPFFEILPVSNSWDGEGGYRERNLLLAFNCTHLLRIVSKRSRTYGSGWTYEKAKGFGRVTFEETVA